jgi:hypothetical protein
MLEHTFTYLPIQYREGKMEGTIFKNQGPQTDPDPASLRNHPDFERVFQEMGRDGWQLVGVQPLLQGQYRFSNNVNTSYGLGFSITAGYYFFWKRHS